MSDNITVQNIKNPKVEKVISRATWLEWVQKGYAKAFRILKSIETPIEAIEVVSKNEKTEIATKDETPIEAIEVKKGKK